MHFEFCSVFWCVSPKQGTILYLGYHTLRGGLSRYLEIERPTFIKRLSLTCRNPPIGVWWDKEYRPYSYQTLQQLVFNDFPFPSPFPSVGWCDVLLLLSVWSLFSWIFFSLACSSTFSLTRRLRWTFLISSLKASSTFVESRADVSMNSMLCSRAKASASSVSTTRKCRRSVLLPTIISTTSSLVLARTSSAHRNTLAKLLTLVMSYVTMAANAPLKKTREMARKRSWPAVSQIYCLDTNSTKMQTCNAILWIG